MDPPIQLLSTATSHGSITRRPATLADLEPLYQIHRAASYDVVVQTWEKWDEPWQQERFRTTYTCTHREIIEVDGQVAGFLEVRFHPDQVFLAIIELSPTIQRQGIGTQLIKEILSKAITLQQPVRLQVLKANTRARSLYERLGFIETGRTTTHFLMQAN